jgi:hypothetical protein
MSDRRLRQYIPIDHAGVGIVGVDRRDREKLDLVLTDLS